MRVCVFGLRGFPEIQGGVEKHCEELYLHFSSIDVDFVIFRRKPYVSISPTYENIRFIDLPSTRIKGLEPIIHSFLSTVQTIFIKPDIVHIHNIGPALFCPLLKFFGRKIVVTYHSPNYEHNKWGYFARMFLKFCEKTVLKYADKLIFVSRYQMERMPVKYQSKYVYVPNGIADDVTPSSNTDLIERIGLEKGRYILALGRITPEKGFDVLVDAFEKASIRDMKLCVAGGVETERKYFESLKSKAGDRVVFPGFVTGELLRQLYSHARLFVLSSRNEGFPLALLDAMAYKLEILASNIPASHFADIPDSNYYEIEDTCQLAALISEKLRKESISYEYNISQFCWNNIADSTMKVYLECLTC